MTNWKISPTSIDYWDGEADYVIFFDENGDADMSNIIKRFHSLKYNDDNNFFGLTAVIFKIDDYQVALSDFLSLKKKYWKNGMCDYKGESKRVCFHSREIRRKAGAFDTSVIDYESFIEDLSCSMINLNCHIATSFINKYKLFDNYGEQSQYPYSLASEYLLERIIFNTKNSDKVTLIFESRGKREDQLVLNDIVTILRRGTYYCSSKLMSRFTGVYFNKKWTDDNQKTYTGLEIADLCAYPIFKYCKDKTKNRAFNVLEKKILGYPDYIGKGIKLVQK